MRCLLSVASEPYRLLASKTIEVRKVILFGQQLSLLRHPT